ncbi:MAG: 50S ribosomal protein L11 methyltransferase [Porphyromonadaceae bacterium]|nr:50S ribosomal protein L11 methyltransferase [Porphyromonadaceae bacterium]
MEYTEVRMEVKAPDVPLVTDVLAVLLAEAGYESFVPDVTGVTAYIPTERYDETTLRQILGDLPVVAETSWTAHRIADRDWNEEWERHYFQPLVIGDACVVHSTFHTDVPKVRYEIVIDPKMAFGTGHHETTSLMMEWILDHDFRGESVLDMGCGTAILAILARMRGACSVTAVDIDPWACENARENIRLNKMDRIEVVLGDKKAIAGRQFDTILANINRNIHLEQMRAYAAALPTGGNLYLSGFYEADLPVLQPCAEEQGLAYDRYLEQNRWVAAHFIKH